MWSDTYQQTKMHGVWIKAQTTHDIVQRSDTMTVMTSRRDDVDVHKHRSAKYVIFSLDCCMQQVISTVLPLLTTATVGLEPHSSDKQPLGLVLHTTLTGVLCVHMMLM